MFPGTNSGRLIFVDNAKAIGIFLIVLGHTYCLDGFIEKLIHSFHVPLFFFLSGILIKETTLKLNFIHYLSRYTRRLVVPYFIFGILSYIFWLATRTFKRDAAEFLSLKFYEPLIDLCYGAYDHIYVNEPLWFFTCLFSATIIFYFVSKISNKILFGLVIILLGIIGTETHKIILFHLPWNIELATVAVVFIVLGYLTKTTNCFHNRYNMATPIVLMTVCGVLNLFIVEYNGRVSMMYMNFGESTILYFAAAVFGIITTLCISKLIPQNAIFLWLSKNTLIIFATHKITLNIIMGIAVFVFNLPISQPGRIWIGILYTFLSISMCIPFVYIINKFSPWAIGN